MTGPHILKREESPISAFDREFPAPGVSMKNKSAYVCKAVVNRRTHDNSIKSPTIFQISKVNLKLNFPIFFNFNTGYLRSDSCCAHQRYSPARQSRALCHGTLNYFCLILINYLGSDMPNHSRMSLLCKFYLHGTVRSNNCALGTQIVLLMILSHGVNDSTAD